MDGAALFEVEKVARQAWEAAVRWGAQTGDADRETSLTLVAVQGDKWCVLRSLAGGLERTLGEWLHSTGLSPLIMEVRTQPGRAHAREMVAWLFAVRDDSNSGCGLFVIAWCCMTLFLGTQEWSLLAPAGGLTADQSMVTSNICLGEPVSVVGFPYRSVGKRLRTRAEPTQRQPCHQSLSRIVSARERWEPGAHCRQPHGLKSALSGRLRWSGHLPGSSAGLCFSQKAQAQLHWEWLWEVLAA